MQQYKNSNVHVIGVSESGMCHKNIQRFIGQISGKYKLTDPRISVNPKQDK